MLSSPSLAPPLLRTPQGSTACAESSQSLEWPGPSRSVGLCPSPGRLSSAHAHLPAPLPPGTCCLTELGGCSGSFLQCPLLWEHFPDPLGHTCLSFSIARSTSCVLCILPVCSTCARPGFSSQATPEGLQGRDGAALPPTQYLPQCLAHGGSQLLNPWTRLCSPQQHSLCYKLQSASVQSQVHVLQSQLPTRNSDPPKWSLYVYWE